MLLEDPRCFLEQRWEYVNLLDSNKVQSVNLDRTIKLDFQRSQSFLEI